MQSGGTGRLQVFAKKLVGEQSRSLFLRLFLLLIFFLVSLFHIAAI